MKNMEKKIWICSDTHFGHQRDFLWGPRGFKNIYEHDRQIIENWNSVVGVEDEVYHLGDVMLNDNEYGLSCLKQLKGKIHIIQGNHDTGSRLELYPQCWNVVEVCAAKYLRVGNQYYFLCHYPTLTSNLDNNKPLKARVINLCGHTHTKDRWCDWNKGVIYHCELDAHNNFPVEVSQIREEIQEKINKGR